MKRLPFEKRVTVDDVAFLRAMRIRQQQEDGDAARAHGCANYWSLLSELDLARRSANHWHRNWMWTFMALELMLAAGVVAGIAVGFGWRW